MPTKSFRELLKEHVAQVTLTTKSTFHVGTLREQFRILKRKIATIFRGLSYNFHPELTKKGNIHFHGTITSTDRPIIEISLHRWARDIGYIYKSTKTPRLWCEYACKHCSSMNIALGCCSCVSSDVETDSPPYQFADDSDDDPTEDPGILEL